MSRQDTKQLSRVVRQVAAAISPEAAADSLLAGALEVSGATHGRLYLLELATGTYESVAAISRGSGAQRIRFATYRDANPSELPPLERASLERRVQIIPDADAYIGPPLPGHYASRMVLPICRETTCLGLLDLDSEVSGHFSSGDDAVQLDALVALATVVYESRFLLRLLQESQEPVDFTLGDEEFNEQVLTLIALSSQMEFAALREYTDDHELRSLGTFGFSEKWQPDDFDLTDLSLVPPFEEVVKTRTPHVAKDMHGERYRALRARQAIDGVQSFVAVPVLVGKELFGVLSFGSSLEYDYTSAEVAGLQSIANGIGVAIENHRNFHAAAVKLASYESTATAITAVEVAQAARHEARGIIDNCVVELAALEGKLANFTASRRPEVVAHVSSLESRLDSLSTVLDKIKSATKAPAREKTTVSLRQVWDEARSQLAGRIGLAKVECDYFGVDVQVYVAVDWFRQVFINLILNSLDAFMGGSSHRRGRRIRLLVERPSDRQAEFVLTYTDNAGGINPSSLRRLDGQTLTKPLAEVIFDPDVTSKEEGSGWGLALVRRILGDHDGSISLIDHRGGTTFRITLPKPPAKQKEPE